MTTIVSTAIEALITVIESKMTGWHRLTNSNIDENWDAFLKKGWGLVIGKGANTDRSNCGVSYRRDYTIVISHEVYGGYKDYKLQLDSLKIILEAINTLAKSFGDDVTLHTSDGNCIVNVLGDSGVAAMDDGKYWYTELNVTMETFTK